jgi:GGDEF domain-containing protein
MDAQKGPEADVLDVMVEAELAVKYHCCPRAIQLLTDVISGHPDYLPARETLCDLYRQEGNLDAANRLTEEMAEIRDRLARQAVERRGGPAADEPTRQLITQVDELVRELYLAKDELVVLKLAAERLLDIAGGDRCLILRVGKSAGTVKHYEHCRAGIGESLESRTARLNFLLLKMLPADGELLVVPDTEEAPALRECRGVLEQFHIRSALVATFAYKATRMGLIICHYSALQPELSSQARDVFLAVAGHLAVALRNAQRLASAPANAASEEIPGLCDKQLFEERLSAELKAAQQQKYPLCLAYLFLENVDGVRDSCSPESLRKMFHKVGLLIRTHIRKGSVVTRPREDEFEIILPNLSRAVAYDVLGNIKRLIDNSIAVEVGSSVGVRLGVLEAAADPVPLESNTRRREEERSAADAATVLLKGAFPLSDVIQILETSEKTGTLTATSGSDVGIVYFNNGRIVNAIFRNESGEPAFFALFAQFALKAASFEFLSSLVPFPEPITSSKSYLLLEGFRLLDEAGRDRLQIEKPTDRRPAEDASLPPGPLGLDGNPTVCL